MKITKSQIKAMVRKAIKENLDAKTNILKDDDLRRSGYNSVGLSTDELSAHLADERDRKRRKDVNKRRADMRRTTRGMELENSQEENGMGDENLEEKNSNWMTNAANTKNKGELSKKLGIPEKDDIPMSVLLKKKKELQKKSEGDKKLTAADRKTLGQVMFAINAKNSKKKKVRKEGIRTGKMSRRQFSEIIKKEARRQLMEGVEVKSIMLDVLRNSGMTDTDILTQLVDNLDDQSVRKVLGGLVAQVQSKN